MSFNKIIIVGNCGRDPELKYTPQGQAICNLSLATSEKRKDQSGDSHEIVTWFRVTIWGKQAEIAHQYLTKGSAVYIEGRLRQTEFTDREGNKRTSLEVNATDMQLIGSRTQSDSAPKAQSAKAAGSQQRDQEWDDLTGKTDPDIPF